VRDDDDFDALFSLMKPNTLPSMRFGSFVLRPKPLFVLHSMGANVHVLYPENDSAAVLQFIKDELVMAFAKMGSTFV
jgi:diphosphomevalonate decarboxylase